MREAARMFLGPMVLCLAMVGSAGCYTSLKENTAFPASLNGCGTIVDCEVVEMEAQRDLGGCTTKTTIYVLAEGPKHISCGDARENLGNIEDKLAKLRAADADHRMQEAQKKADLQVVELEQREEQSRERRAQQEKDQLASQVARQAVVVQTCDVTKDARVARKKHMDILHNQRPGAFVRGHCTARHEMSTVQSQCTDANGFIRTCTKQVPGEDIVGYSCSRSIDTDIVKLGLFQLNLSDGYPFPLDQQIEVHDEDCEVASSRLKELQDRAARFNPPQLRARYHDA